MGSLPSANDDFSNSSHCLRIRRHDAYCTHVVQEIFCRDRFLANARFGKLDIFRNVFVELMTHHQHIFVFIKCVDGIVTGRICRSGQNIVITAHFENVRCMSPTSSFSMEGVNNTVFKRRNGSFHKPSFVERVSVKRHLYVVLICNGKTIVNHSSSGSPVFMHLQTDDSRIHLLDQAFGLAGTALAQQANVNWQGFSSF